MFSYWLSIKLDSEEKSKITIKAGVHYYMNVKNPEFLHDNYVINKNGKFIFSYLLRHRFQLVKKQKYPDNVENGIRQISSIFTLKEITSLAWQCLNHLWEQWREHLLQLCCCFCFLYAVFSNHFWCAYFVATKWMGMEKKQHILKRVLTI